MNKRNLKAALRQCERTKAKYAKLGFVDLVAGTESTIAIYTKALAELEAE